MNWFFSDQFLFPGNFYKHFLLANFFWKFNQGERCCISIYRSESKLIEVDQVVCFSFIYKQLWIILFSDQFLFPGNFYKHFLLANFFWKFNQGERCCISIYRSESKLIEVDQVVCFLFIYKQLWINFFSDQFFFPANFCKHLIANWRSGKVGTNCCRLWISTLWSSSSF